jgi:hypothetical protein
LRTLIDEELMYMEANARLAELWRKTTAPARRENSRSVVTVQAKPIQSADWVSSASSAASEMVL